MARKIKVKLILELRSQADLSELLAAGINNHLESGNSNQFGSNLFSQYAGFDLLPPDFHVLSICAISS